MSNQNLNGESGGKAALELFSMRVDRYFKARSVARLSGLCVLTVIAAGPAGAAWKTLGPFGGAAAAIVSDLDEPANLVAATHAGLIYKSIDGGANWSSVAFPRALFAVHVLAIAPGSPAV